MRGRSGVGHAPLHGEIDSAAAAFDEHLLAVDDDEFAVGKARFDQRDAGLRQVDGRGEARLLVGDVELPILDVAVGTVVALGLGTAEIPL